jgi:cobalt-zinc-cadmium efflux system protein
MTSQALVGNRNHQVSRRLALALVITVIFVVVEALAGWVSNSLALLTDAAHNLTDVTALALSWYAIRLAARPANAERTYGYHRAGILVALLNAVTLGVITLWIFYEAYQRLLSPPEIQDTILVVVAVLALLVNAGTAWLVHSGHEHDLNLRSAFFHLAGDALSSLGALAAGIIIYLTGAYVLDPLVSILIGAFILWNAWKIVRESVDILLEGTPADLDMQQLVADVKSIPGVRGIHDLHVWSINQQMRALSVHVLVDDTSISQGASTQRDINALLAARYGITHTTLQMECADCMPDLLYCNLEEGNHHPELEAISDVPEH